LSDPATPKHDRRALLASGVGAAVALALPLVSARRASAAASPVVDTRQGRVAGYADSGISIFKGIPYGEDTSRYRFRAPVARAPWQGVREAQVYGPAAPQSSPEEPMSEDCLVLNVWSPGLDNKRRAVMVYIHGGGFSGGSGSSPLYDGVALCQPGDVVVVTLNHRLNVFGYLFLQKLGGERYAGGGNAGQLDLVLALEWVRDNIERFGGDPKRVMLFGQSGGGAKIATLLAMPRARSLFHRAITMSGQQVTASGPNGATRRAQGLLDALKLDDSKLEELGKLPYKMILEASRAPDPLSGSGSLYFGPVLDDAVLPRHPFFPDAPALSHDIPLVLGNTHDETRTLIGRDHPECFDLPWDGLAQRIAKELEGRTDIDADLLVREYRRLYPKYTASEVFFAATTAGRSWRGQLIEAELRARANAPTWVYELDWRSPLDGGKWRAPHTLDIPLAFDNTRTPNALSGDDAAARQMAKLVSGAFIAFAKTGNPNAAGLPRWPQYRLERRATLILDLPPVIADDPRGAERRLFASAPYVQPGS
jgi:para-nitrobenzyl esterase